MIRSYRIPNYFFLLFTCSTLQAASLEEVIAGMQQASRQQISGVNNYWVKRDSSGIATFEYYEKLTAIDSDGTSVEYMRMVPPAEMYQSSEQSPFRDASPTDLRAAADAVRSQGPRMEDGLREEMAKSDLPGGIAPLLMNPPPGKPWLSANPNDMMGMYADMLEAGATAKEVQAAQDARDRQEALVDNSSLLLGSLTITGEETLNNRPAIVLKNKAPVPTQSSGSMSYVINDLTLWVDSQKFVTLKMQMEGDARQGNEVRPLKIELENKNYQPVSGCPGFELPIARVMRMSGMMSSAEQSEMTAQMAQMQSQLDSLPEAQRKMIEAQMGPQLAMMRNMAAGNGIEMTSAVTEISCNTGLPDPREIVSALIP